jgi:flavodoxin
MYIAILVYSQTGTTEKFASAIARECERLGHSVETTLLIPDAHKVTPATKELRVINVPDCRQFDAVLFGSPVWGGRPTPVIKAAITQARGIENKPVVPFVTMGFPLAVMGGTQSLNAMHRAAAARGARVLQGYAVQKLFHNTEKDIAVKAARCAAQLA